VAEFRKNTESTTWEDGGAEETTAKKVITFQRAMTKNNVPSDATGRSCKLW